MNDIGFACSRSIQSGGWGPFVAPFCVTGHEIVGEVVQVVSINLKSREIGAKSQDPVL